MELDAGAGGASASAAPTLLTRRCWTPGSCGTPPTSPPSGIGLYPRARLCGVCIRAHVVRFCAFGEGLGECWIRTSQGGSGGDPEQGYGPLNPGVVVMRTSETSEGVV